MNTRHDSKLELDVPRKASFSSADSASGPGEGWIERLSVAGLEIASLDTLPPAGASVTVWAELFDGEGVVTMAGRVQWCATGRFAVQFSPLGARETSAIVRASRRPPPP